MVFASAKFILVPARQCIRFVCKLAIKQYRVFCSFVLCARQVLANSNYVIGGPMYTIQLLSNSLLVDKLMRSCKKNPRIFIGQCKVPPVQTSFEKCDKKVQYRIEDSYGKERVIEKKIQTEKVGNFF